MSQYQVRHTITTITIPGVPHNVQGGVQANVQLPTVLQERPPAEVWIQEEMLNQVKFFVDKQEGSCEFSYRTSFSSSPKFLFSATRKTAKTSQSRSVTLLMTKNARIFLMR